MRRPILLVILIAVAGFSWLLVCARNSRISGQTPSIRLDYFPSLPKVIDGCSGTYTYDSVSLKKEKYIFADDLQEHAFIYVAGKEIALKRTSHVVLAGGKTFKDVYTGSGYTVTAIVKDVKDVGDEGSYETGALEVRKGQFVLKLKIHGVAGC